MATVVLKIKCKGEIYRGVVEGPLFAYESVLAVLEKVSKLYGEPSAYKAKYLDEDGDNCLLVPATFSDFSVTACYETNGRKVYKLELFLEGGSAVPTKKEADLKATHDCHSEREWHHHGKSKKLWWLHPRKLMWLFSRLRASGALNGEVVAAMLAKVLPEVLDHKEMTSIIDVHVPDEKKHKIINHLKELVVNKVGFEQCDLKLTQFINGECAASEAILSLLQTVQSLEFDSRMLFLMDAFKFLEEKINKILDDVDTYTPDVYKTTVEHLKIVCDGCGAKPIRGPRFTCKTRHDYDLCATCYVKAGRDEEKAGHEYEMHVLDYHSKAFGDMMAARKAMAQQCCQPNPNPGKPCAAGCGYATTWHPTHCCHACKMSGGQKHGGRCQKQKFEKEAAEEEAASKEAASEKTSFDLSFPVEVEDGRQLVIEWNFGDKPEDVAKDFALKHCIPLDEFSTITDFIHQAQAQIQQVDPKAEESKVKDQQQEATPEPNTDASLEVSETSEKTTFDFSFPVVVEDGRQLVLEWNFDDQPGDVAKDFALKHGIPLEEETTIIAFVLHVHECQMKANAEVPKAEEPKDEEPKAEEPEAENPPQVPPSETMQEKLRKRFQIVDPQATEGKEAAETDTDAAFVDGAVQQLLAMGFGEQCSPEALKMLVVDCGGDIENVVQHLLQQ